MKSKPIPFILLGVFALWGIFIPLVADHVSDGYNFGDVAWMIVATAFVLLMTPGFLSFMVAWLVKRM